MSSPIDMLRLLAMSQKLAPSNTEPMSYERLTSGYDPKRGDVRANDNLFCELCKKAAYNTMSTNGATKIDSNTFESLAKHKAPAGLIESSSVEDAEARIFSKSGGSVILAKIDKKSQSIIPYAVKESKTWFKSYWFHTKTDTYRFEAQNAEQARTMFESQVPEKDRRGDISIDVQDELKNQSDEGAPYTLTIFKNNGERQSMQEMQTIAQAFTIAVSESFAGEKFTIRDNSKKIVLNHEGCRIPTSTANEKPELPLIDNIPDGKLVIMMQGESIGLIDSKLGRVLLWETGSGANVSDRYLIVKRVSGNSCLVEEAKPGMLTQRDKDTALLVEDLRTCDMALNESASEVNDKGFQDFMEKLEEHGFRGMSKSIEESLFNGGFIYSEALGIGLHVSAGTPPSLWSQPIYKTFRADALGLREKIGGMPREFFEHEGSDTLRRYMAGWDNAKAVRDIIEWNGVALPEVAMTPQDVVKRISRGHDSKADLYAETLIKVYGANEAQSRAEKMHRKYEKEFPEEGWLRQFFSTVRSRIKTHGSARTESAKDTFVAEPSEKPV